MSNQLTLEVPSKAPQGATHHWPKSQTMREFWFKPDPDGGWLVSSGGVKWAKHFSHSLPSLAVPLPTPATDTDGRTSMPELPKVRGVYLCKHTDNREWLSYFDGEYFLGTCELEDGSDYCRKYCAKSMFIYIIKILRWRLIEADHPTASHSADSGKSAGRRDSDDLPLESPHMGNQNEADDDGLSIGGIAADRDRAGIEAAEATRAQRINETAHAFFNQRTVHPADCLMVIAPYGRGR